jgi:group II intron reverse transcriptase/maturase
MPGVEVCVMQRADTILDIYQKRGSKGLPLERVYRHLFDPELFLRAYGKIYRNAGAMTKGSTEETVDGMSLRRVHDVIGFLRTERYDWTPVRRTSIPKANGKKRPLGIPTWGDKLVQEVLRALLEAYYEQRFSDLSHGFRPGRSCHTALRQIRERWKGTVWFIEGDIKGCFDNIDHAVLLEIIRRDIHDGRLVRLIEGLLRAGYMEDWRFHDTTSGTPQGGILSPLLANIYLNDLDKFVEDTLIPANTRGSRRRANPAYKRLSHQIEAASGREDPVTVKRLRQERREVMAVDPCDPGHRRLRYVRYADDFLLGFVGPKSEAEEIRRRIGEYLGRRLKLTLSPDKTLITHAADGHAKFLGYEITVTRERDCLVRDRNGTQKRHANGCIALLMPQEVCRKYRGRFSEGGKIVHRAELLADSDYTILQRYQSVLRGVYNYYCMATNVSRRMRIITWVLETSLTKTLASKYRVSVNRIYEKYLAKAPETRALQVVVERPGKTALVATFGGIPFRRIPEGLGGEEFRFAAAWFKHGGRRTEVVQRLTAGECELCGEGPVEVHHLRRLADIDRPGRRPKEEWERIMAARKRKTLVVCMECHDRIHAGRYDGPPL